MARIEPLADVSVEAVGLVKLDILAQGGLAVMRDARATLLERGIAVENACRSASTGTRAFDNGRWVILTLRRCGNRCRGTLGCATV